MWNTIFAGWVTQENKVESFQAVSRPVSSPGHLATCLVLLARTRSSEPFKPWDTAKSYMVNAYFVTDKNTYSVANIYGLTHY